MGCGAQSTTQEGQPAVLSPQSLPKYIRKQLIGKGTYGQVYKCIDPITNTVYAMKVIKISADTKQKAFRQIGELKSQISMLKKLNHPNIVKYQSFDVTPNLDEVEIVMELVKPGTLKQHIEKNGAISQSTAAQIGAKILKALAYLHEQNIIHRDLKCANILINEQMQPKISDFGTAKIVYGKDKDDIARLSASLKGTPFYMAPEVIKRTGHNQSADIWSFGCTMIEMLSGKAPWTLSGAKFSQILNYISSGVHPPFPPNLSRECNFFLESCLDPVPSNRLTALELLKHRFIDKTGLIYETNKKNRPIKESQLNIISKADQTVEQLRLQELQNKQGQATRQSTMRKYQNSNEKIQVKQINNGVLSKTDSNKDFLKQNNKQQIRKGTLKKPTQKYLSQMNELDLLQAQMVEVEISDDQLPKDKYYIKKTLANLKSKKYGKNISRTSATIKNAQENLGTSSSIMDNYKDYQLRSNTENSRDQLAINTMISRAERNQYLQQQKHLQKQKEDQKRKWEQELQQGAHMLKKQLSNRYVFNKL